LGVTPLRRLTNAEFARSADALVGATLTVGRTLPADATHFGFSNNADGMTTDGALFERYETATAELATAVVNPPAGATRRLPTCDAATVGVESCARTKLTDLAARAWRRPVAAPELEAHVQRVAAAVRDGDRFDDALILGAQGILLSPHFLFRMEAPATGPEPRRISDIELATRLSYFLWSSLPDDALRAAAESGQLSSAEGLEQQARRMLADPRSKALLETFGDEWLQISAATSISPNPTLFPGVDAALKSAMQQESELVFKELLHSGRSFKELFTADFTFLDDRLAAHYGLPPVGSTTPVRVQLTDRRRGGILKQAGLLALTSAPTRTSIVKRGQWVLSRLMCEELSLPDGVVNELNTMPAPGTSLRAQLEAHRVNPACAGCHNRLDPIGFGLEHYDAVGQWRDTEGGGAPIDARGTLPPQSAFSGADELSALLAADPRVTACAVRKMATFAAGRSMTDADQCELDRLTHQFDASGAKPTKYAIPSASST